MIIRSIWASNWCATVDYRWPFPFQFSWFIKLQSPSCVKQQFSPTSGVFTSCPKHSFMICWHVFWSDSNIIRQEIFGLDKFWLHWSSQITFKSLVWHLLCHNILIIEDFMKVYENLITFITSQISNIFCWQKCLTIGLKVFWVLVSKI